MTRPEPTEARSIRRTPQRSAAPAPSGAYTLMEMLLTLVIVSALLAMMAVSLAGRRDHQALRVAAEDLAASLRYAAERSKLTGRSCRVAFNDDYTGYRLEIATGRSADSFSPDIGLAGAGRRFAEGVRLVGEARADQQGPSVPRTLTFAPDGKGFAGSLRLKNRANESIEIEVAPETHQVHLLR